ncbi:MAG TPA: helix-turn-helix domain-containing protein [Dehalococcoidales bacterium]
MAQTIRSKEEGINTLMTASEVAAFLRVHLGSVRRWSRTGKLKGYRLGGRGDWRYDRRDVLAFLQHAQNS